MQAALTIREDVGPASPEAADVLVSLADLALARGRPEQAIAPLKRAVEIRSAGGVPDQELAQARARLAQALRAAATDSRKGGRP